MTDFEKTAALAMLSVAPCEKDDFERDIENMIKFADKIAEFSETEDCGEFCGAEDCGSLRGDVPGGSFERNEILSNAPQKTAEYICVPKSF